MCLEAEAQRRDETDLLGRSAADDGFVLLPDLRGNELDPREGSRELVDAGAELAAAVLAVEDGLTKDGRGQGLRVGAVGDDRGRRHLK